MLGLRSADCVVGRCICQAEVSIELHDMLAMMTLGIETAYSLVLLQDAAWHATPRKACMAHCDTK